MVTVHLVKCVEDLNEFVKGQLYVHKVSKKGNHTVRLDSAKGSEWVPVLSIPKLKLGWKHDVFNRHFEIIAKLNTKNYFEASAVQVSDIVK